MNTINECNPKKALDSKIIDEYEKLKSSFEELNEKFDFIFNNINNLIFILDKNHRYTYINEKVHERILGYLKEDLLGIKIQNFIHKDDLESINYLLKICVLEGSIVGICRLRRKNNSYIWVELKCKKISDNESYKFLIIGNDISKRIKLKELEKKLIKEIKKQNLELIKLNKLKDEFIQDIVHEIRSPLTNIILYNELILKENKISDEIKEYLNVIYNNANKINNLINELINYIELDEDIFKFKKERFKVSQIVKSIKESFKLKLLEKNLKIIENYEPDDTIILDKTQITRLIRNLIGNAIKFSFPNTEIVIHSKISDGIWEFSVKDVGIGIKKEDLPKLFIRFGKLENHKNKNFEGLGLGLSICKKIVQRYKGTIWAESDGLYKGAVFKFRIPLIN